MDSLMGSGFAWSWGPQEAESGVRVVDLKAVAAEFVAMVFFVTIGCGTVCGHGAFDAASRLQVAFAFGTSIMVLAYAIGKHSGGQINSAVTLSLMLGGVLPWYFKYRSLFVRCVKRCAGVTKQVPGPGEYGRPVSRVNFGCRLGVWFVSVRSRHQSQPRVEPRLPKILSRDFRRWARLFRRISHDHVPVHRYFSRILCCERAVGLL
jgi:hypothetical protein